ncbi:carboxypeptidase regulatory-like domain-containing protein [Streptomyces sp. NPDC003393]
MKSTSLLRRLMTPLIVGVVVAGMSLTAATTARAVPSEPASPSTQSASKSPATPARAPAKKSTSPTTTGSQAADAEPACQPSPTRKYTCFALMRTDVRNRTMAVGDTPAGYGPSDIQDAYDLPASSNSPTVAIVDAFDDPQAESDLAVYRAQYGLPPCTTDNGCFTKVAQDGSKNYPPTPPPGDNWAGEIALDLDAVSAACPSCHILLVEATTDQNFDSLPTAVETARKMGAKYISMSWGAKEDGTENSYEDEYFNHRGVVYTASSGDGGYQAARIYPSTSRYVTSVGGTTLRRNPDTASGWSESAWSLAGSGCSMAVTKPAWQKDNTACTTRADTDISAVADLNTGLATYNTHGGHGWEVVGGTSLSAPLVAAMYALAGTPAAGTYPVTYPYDDPARADDLNDVTSGSNGTCTPKVLCTAGPGWDGPTGLGTPHGVGALTTGPHGNVEGTVTDTATGEPVAGVRVSTSDGRHTSSTDADGSYDLVVPPGTYDLTATKYGYVDKSITGVAVATDASVTENFAMTAKPLHTVSGTVSDGSGHGWAMRAKITVDGYPDGPVYSDPYTGHYSVSLPAGASYKLHVSAADLTGYTGQNLTVAVADSDVSKDIGLKVDTSTCTATGYAFQQAGTTEAFTGWSGKTPKDGWTITDAIGNGQTWSFDNPGSWLTPPGGDEYFANVNSEDYGKDGKQDTSLVSPVIDLTGKDKPEIGFDSAYIPFPDGSAATIDLSLDGGSTWSNVWKPSGGVIKHVDVPIPQAAGKSAVRVRFHYTGSNSRSWNVDNVLIGTRTCTPQAGGLVAGIVTDANTGTPLIGATVTSDVSATQSGGTTATPDDPGLGDGYYWLFSSHTGSTGFSVKQGRYTPTRAKVTVPADGVRHRNFKLKAGHLTITQQKVSTSLVLGAAKSKSVSFGNDGTSSVHVNLHDEDAGYAAMGTASGATVSSGAPITVTKTKTSLAAPPQKTAAPRTGPVVRPAGTPEVGPWTGAADYPEPIQDAVVAGHDGKVYVAGGYNGTYAVQDANVYDPGTETWSPIASLPERLEASASGFIGDTLYIAGGFNDGSGTSTHTYAYHPDTDKWTQLADMPAGAAGAGSAVVDGQLYVIGGCTDGRTCSPTSSVESYDPGSNTWTKAPDYPTALTFAACGGVNAEVVCAGGSGFTSLTSTYAYSPGAGGWTAKADMPVDAWGAASTTANGKLEVMGGAINDGTEVTNQGFAYDPDTNTWSPLPNSNSAGYRGGAACGIYKVGGSGPSGTSSLVEHLPGYDQCATAVGWMSENTTSFDVAPGQTVTVRITTDSSTLSQPGTYQGVLVVGTDTPYGNAQPVGVTMNVKPPKTWGKVTGTVSDSSGAPVAGATVAICTMYVPGTGRCGPTTYTLKTDGHGAYQLWLDKGFDPLQIIAAKDGYTPLMKIARIRKGATTTVDFTMVENGAFTQTKTQKFLTAHMHSRSAE